MKEVRPEDIEDNLDPVLLFTAVQGKTTTQEYGVYFVPQQGVGMKGLVFDGSTVSVAKRIANMGSVSITPGVINPKPNVDSIVNAVNTWMHSWMGKGEPEPVAADEEDDTEET
jgi:hypothetical protein